MNKVRDYWDKQAATFGTSDTATAPDSFYREHEIACVISELHGSNTVLDAGCGNGYSTLKYATAFPSSRFIGIDYSAPMIEAAQQAAERAKARNVSFLVEDVIGFALDGAVDTVVSTRCLINLANWEEQRRAIRQLSKSLGPSGRLILVENMREGLAELNRLRAAFDLPAIQERHHNCYLPIDKVREIMTDEFNHQKWRNIGGLYYLISRVVYAALAKEAGDEPQYDHPINKIAAQLARMNLECGNYSPNYMIVGER
jgi:SAM-dependent methyltransferase